MTQAQLIARELHARYRISLAAYAARFGVTAARLEKHLNEGTTPAFIAFDMSETLGISVQAPAQAA